MSMDVTLWGRMRIRHRLFAAYASVVALMTIIAVFSIGSGVRRGLVETFQDELGRQLALGEWILGGAGDAGPDGLARQITDRIGYRVTLMSPEGVILGDSYVDPERLSEVENHSDRPEVIGALAGSVTFAQRTSATVATPLMYGATLVELGGRPVVLRLAAPLTEIERAVDRAQFAIALSGFMAMGVALLIAWFFSHALSEPLARLAALSRKLAGGAYDERAPESLGVVELDELGLAFNRLTTELQERVDDLEFERDGMQALIDCMAEGVVALTEDARVFRTNRAARLLLGLDSVREGTPVQELVRHSELRRVLAESAIRPITQREVRFGDAHLIVSSRTLDIGGAVTTLLDVSETRRLENVRRDFVANASHEIKTPLTSIRGYAETLMEDDIPERLREGFVTSIRNNALRLQNLVDDLLDLSRLESGGWVARPEPVSIADVATDAWSMCQEVVVPRDITLSVDSDVEVFADRQGLQQCFRNLFENAARHSDVGGVIRVGARHVGPQVAHVEVSDDGEGIPARALPRIFERFYRADTGRGRDIGGTGLGLAIVRHMIEGMGGRVQAESQIGSGTTIRMVLPTAAPAAQGADDGLDPSHGAPNAPASSQESSTTTLFPGAADGAVA
jgi:two-component system phosphate regulon sensor histidine kinase PhoR